MNERFVFAVAQEPFDAPKREGSWETNTFCSLVPLIDSEGEPANPADFHNCGLVWWMVRASSSGFAEPGRLVVGTLQKAIKWEEDEASSMLYQVDVQSVDPVRPTFGVEILTIPTTAITEIDDLLNRKDVIRLDHHPTSIVFTHWNGRIHGPWRVTADSHYGSAPYTLNFVPESASTVFEITESEFSGEYGATIRSLEAVITDEKSNPRTGVPTRLVRYEILLGEGRDKLGRASHPTIKLSSDEEALRSLAKSLLSRAPRQEFVRQLEDLVGLARTRGEEGPRLEAAIRILDRQKSAVAAFDEIADGILRSGLLADALKEAQEKAAAAYVENNATRLYADVVRRSEAEQKRLEEITRQREREESEFETLKARNRQELESKLEERRRAVEEELRSERSELGRLRTELDTQREIVGRHLTELATKFATGRDELIQDFLAMRPLLEQIGISWQHKDPVAAEPAEIAREAPRLNVSSSILRDDDSAEPLLEEEFFGRLQQVIASSGFEYQKLDLINFHVAVKTNDVTILGGFSGTGKSSLVDLYSRAAAGGSGNDDRFLQVWVSPSWLDAKDLLGHVNALSQTFQPSESGLFEFVAIAQQEWEKKGPGSGVHLVCLDEMNLAQVEHYFGAFLQALPSRTREVPVFDPGSIMADSPYRPFAKLRLSPALRFIGTVNFDETTRQLSLRLLDRADLIRLNPPDMAMVTRSTDRMLEPIRSGRAVRLRDLQSWTRDTALRSELATTLDDLRPPLELLGCPLTPRRYRAIRKFVSSAVPLCNESEAFDLQVANRILPQVRNVFTSAARTSLQKIRGILENRQLAYSLRVFDTTLADFESDTTLQ